MKQEPATSTRSYKISRQNVVNLYTRVLGVGNPNIHGAVTKKKNNFNYQPPQKEFLPSQERTTTKGKAIKAERKTRGLTTMRRHAIANMLVNRGLPTHLKVTRDEVNVNEADPMMLTTQKGSTSTPKDTCRGIDEFCQINGGRFKKINLFKNPKLSNPPAFALATRGSSHSTSRLKKWRDENVHVAHKTTGESQRRASSHQVHTR